MSLPSFIRRMALSALACLLVAMPAAATTVTLSTTPPGVTSKVAPNIVVTFDDSGSMNSTAIPDAMDASYATKVYYSAKGNPIYFDPTVTYVVPPDATGAPLGTPAFTAAWRDGYCANTLTKKCWAPSSGKYIAPNVVDLSTAFYAGFLANTLAGNSPCARDANELTTWYDNGSCSQMDIPTSVRGATTTTTTSTANSTCTNTGCGSANGTTGTHTYTGSDGSSSTYTCTATTSGRGNNKTTTTSCNVATTTTKTSTTYDQGGFYYVCTSATSDSTCTYHLVANESAATQQNFANWYSFYRTRNLNARAAVGRVFGSIGDGAVRVAWQTLQSQSASGSYNTTGSYSGPSYGPLASTSKILELANATTGCTATSTSDSCWRSQFMNWLYGAPASGGTPTRVATVAAGEFFKRTLKTSPTSQDPYWNGSTSTPGELSCRKNFNMLVTDGYWNGDNPSTVSPNDNKAVTLPDGTSYSISDGTSRIFWNQTGTTNPSLADIAFAYWANDLRSDLKDNVPAYYPDLTTGITGSAATVNTASPGATPEVYFNPSNDPATWQHMSQYMVTMGISGSLTYPDDYAALRTGSNGKKWPTPNTSGGATNIDDTWHAALNSRGGYFSAADPTSLVNSLSTILSSVIASSSTALTLSLSTNVLTTNAVAYYAGYDTTDWSGSLLAKAVGTDGSIGTTLWSAGTLLTERAASDPRILTTGTGPGTGTGVAFAYANLSATEQAAINSSDGSGSTATTDGLGASRVDWLSGVRTLEGTSLRTRTSLLGAVFGSQPAFVGAPTGGYSDTFPSGSPEAVALKNSSANSYSRFLATWANRPSTVYVGANDGMLHAFDARLASVSGASPGREIWGYVPASVYANLPAQSRLNKFAFTPTVDGSPVTGDVFFNGDNAQNNSSAGWHTLLVGSLRMGGRGVFGIDITDPSAATLSSSAAVAKKVLWEFNSGSVSTAGTPANLGYTFGTPVIARVAYTNTDNSVGRWVVLVPGGYFPDGSTISAASNTYSSLFVLDAQTGTLLKEIRTPTGTGAVASHGLTTPAVGDYDGDQVADVAFAGDLDGNVWRIDLSAASLASTTQSQGVSLLFQPDTANAQSITTPPRLLADPTSAYFMVIFGTGRFLSTADTSDTTTQAFYGIRDPGKAVTTPTTVAGGTLIQQTMTVDSATGAIGVTSKAVASTSAGWYLPLNNPSGERVVVTPALDSSNNTVTFSTLIPTANDPCTTSSSGSVIALDGTTGAAAIGVSIGSAVSFGTGYSLAGAHVTGAASSGSLYTAASLSGGTAYAAGQLTSAGSTFGTSIPTARRRAWRVLNSEN
ncbi:MULTISPECIES: pilus assembly protein [Luteibacter]|uniref:pilus assembly protein n=1 Tax=Luteibacter TaxID=242605 RepID=UPI00056AA00D|nr:MULTISPECIES: PilC/PilY family type IV pilus protein [unclassified Luteibacter]